MKTGSTLSNPDDSATSAKRGAAARRDAESLCLSPPAGATSQDANAREASSRDAHTTDAFSGSSSTPSKKPRRKWGGLVAVLVLLLAGVGYWGLSVRQLKDAPTETSSPTPSSTVTEQQNSTTKAMAETSTLESALGLALQGISLFSGEKGAELWRLKASWAHLSRENNEILVDLPVVRYTMGEPMENVDPGSAVPDALQNATQKTSQTPSKDTPPADYLDVKSEKGKITDSQRYLTLWGNVDVRRFGDVLTGPRMEYDSKTRIMVFPEGAVLDSPKGEGEAARLTWNLASNELVGEGGVVVVIKPEPEAETDADTPVEISAPEPVAPKVTKPVTTTKTTRTHDRKATRAAEPSGR